MASSSQELQFLDLSGVGDEECQKLLALFDGDNPAVEVLAPEPNVKPNWNSSDQTTTPSPPADEKDDAETSECVPQDGQDANQTIFYPDGEEYSESVVTPDAVSQEIPPTLVSNTSNITTETEATVVVTPEVLPSNTEVQYPQVPSNGPPPPPSPQPHPQEVGRTVFSPRPHMAPHPTPNMYTMPPPGHGGPPPPGPPPSLYQQGPPPSHIQPAGPTVYVANCHVNVGAFGGGQPQGGPMLPSPHQPPALPQSFPQYMHIDQPHLPIKNIHDKSDFEPHSKRYDQGSNYRGYRGRGRGRGRGRRREEHERSNSVSSDHSSYSDGKHYKDNSINVPSHFSNHMSGQIPYPVQYSLGMQGQYMVQARQAQGHPLMYNPHPNQPPPQPQFLPGHYHNQAQSPMLAYPPHPHPTHMQHMQDTQHPVIPQPINYNQGSSMITQQNITPHQTGVYMGQSGPENTIVVSLTHDPMINSNDSINHSPAVLQMDEQPIDINMSSSIPVSTPIMQSQETPQSVCQPQPIYIESVSVDSKISPTVTSCSVPSSNKTEIQTSISVQTTQVEVTAQVPTQSNLVSVTVTQASHVQVSVSESAEVPVHTPEIDNVSNESIIRSPVSISNVTTSVSNLTDVEVPTQTTPSPVVATENVKKCASVLPSPIIISSNKSGEVTTPNANVNTLIVDMSTKLQITSLPSKAQQQDIGEISFMEEASSISLVEETEEIKSEVVVVEVPEPKVAEVKADPIVVIDNPPTVSVQPQSPPQAYTVPVANIQKPQSPPQAYTVPAASIQQQSTSQTYAVPEVQKIQPENSPIDLDTIKYKSVEEVPEVAPSPPGGAWAQKKSWSKLFKPNEDPSGKRVAYVTPFIADVSKSRENSPGTIDYMSTSALPDHPIAEADIDMAKIGAMLKTYSQNYHAIPLQPRGLINKGYWCYVNAPLQALLACPPFYNLSCSIPNVVGLKKGKSSTPVIDSMVEFVCEFSAVDKMLKLNRKEKTSAQALRKDPDIMPGQSFEPSYVYKMLAAFSGEQFKEGRQQDAEEMLSFVLNGLHDEMVSSLKLAGVGNVPNDSVNGTMNGDGLTHSVSDQDEEFFESDTDEWQVIGPRKKSCVTRTAHFSPSPISEIFWGQLRFIQHQNGGGITTANLQPFTTLPLDIQAVKVESVREALEQLVNREEVSFMCSKTNEELTVSKQVLLEHLPQVLILQLKRFIYNKDGGLQKVTKRISFSIDLEITKELMSPISRGKFTSNQRKYKLLAVIYHDGKEASKGHYVADIYHGGYNCWLHYDDAVVKPVSEAIVLKHAPPRVPYLLFYRRVDTMSGPSSKQKT